MSAKTAKALGAELTEKRQALQNLFDSLKTDDGGYDRSKNPQVIDEIRRRNDELDTLGKEYQEAKSFEVMASRNAEGLAELSEPAEPIYASAKSTTREQPAPTSLGEMFVKSVYNADKQRARSTPAATSPASSSGMWTARPSGTLPSSRRP
jgi:hypothetical protein